MVDVDEIDSPPLPLTLPQLRRHRSSLSPAFPPSSSTSSSSSLSPEKTSLSLRGLQEEVERCHGCLLNGERVLSLHPHLLATLREGRDALHELRMLKEDAPLDQLRCLVMDIGQSDSSYHRTGRLNSILERVPRLRVHVPPSERRRGPGLLPASFLVTLTMFSSLTHLELSGFALPSTGVEGLQTLRRSLRTLRTSDCALGSLRELFVPPSAELEGAAPWPELHTVSCTRANLSVIDGSVRLLPSLTSLDLSLNSLTSIGGEVKFCRKLSRLDVSFNKIAAFLDVAETLQGVRTLLIQYNCITCIDGLDRLVHITSLDLTGNLISDVEDVAKLARLPALSRLWLEKNPISLLAGYRVSCLSLFPSPEEVELDGKGADEWELLTAQARTRVGEGWEHEEEGIFKWFQPWYWYKQKRHGGGHRRSVSLGDGAIADVDGRFLSSYVLHEDYIRSHDENHHTFGEEGGNRNRKFYTVTSHGGGQYYDRVPPKKKEDEEEGRGKGRGREDFSSPHLTMPPLFDTTSVGHMQSPSPPRFSAEVITSARISMSGAKGFLLGDVEDEEGETAEEDEEEEDSSFFSESDSDSCGSGDDEGLRLIRQVP